MLFTGDLDEPYGYLSATSSNGFQKSLHFIVTKGISQK